MTAVCSVANAVGKTTRRRPANSAYPRTLGATCGVVGINEDVTHRQGETEWKTVAYAECDGYNVDIACLRSIVAVGQHLVQIEHATKEIIPLNLAEDMQWHTIP